MQLTRNFRRQEFDCADGTTVPSWYMDNVRRLAENLQVLRDYFGRSVSISSAYRTPAHNRSVGGVDGSYHTFAMAADISVQDTSPAKVYCAIERLISRGGMQDGGLGYYGRDGHIHYDIGHARRWTKPNWLSAPTCPEEDEVTQEELRRLNARLDSLDGGLTKLREFDQGLVELLGQLAEKRIVEQAFHRGIAHLVGGIYEGHGVHSARLKELEGVVQALKAIVGLEA